MLEPRPAAEGRPLPFRSVHVAGGGAVAAALAVELGARGVAVSTGGQVASGVDAIALLAGLESDGSEAEARVRQVFQQLRALGGGWRDRAVSVLVAFDAGGRLGFTHPDEDGDGAVDPVLGGIAGLAKTAAREWPQASVRVIDFAVAGRRPAEAAGALIAEWAEHEPEIARHATGQRRAPVLRRVPGRAAPRTLTAGGAWVVSGGARGVTVACLGALVRRAPTLRLLLLGRTPLAEEPAAVRGAATDAAVKQALLAEARRAGRAITPRELQQTAAALFASREARASLDALRGAGAEVRYVAADVTDRLAVEHAVAAVRGAWGPIRGVVHAAGVLADKALHEKTDEQFQRVYATKVGGFRNLLAATAGDPLEVLCAFSSVAARFGNAGQADYAAANEVLNKLCQVEQRRRGAGCMVRAIGWGPWDGGMVGAGLKAHFAALGVPLIPLAAGAEVFADIVTGARPVAVESVVGGGWPGLDPREVRA